MRWQLYIHEHIYEALNGFLKNHSHAQYLAERHRLTSSEPDDLGAIS